MGAGVALSEGTLVLELSGESATGLWRPVFTPAFRRSLPTLTAVS